ncbi:hypothetical protein KSP40_PGU006408 [Platanthera guangdongensis]|uniref:Uncharacterized protein n=1 Tax=Platanthera guangdongensis TaxID=2320717 RepID=A0ABR2MVQ4_9ASPA
MAAILSSALIAPHPSALPPTARKLLIFRRSSRGSSAALTADGQFPSSSVCPRKLSNCSASTSWSPLPTRNGSRAVRCDAAGEGPTESLDGTVYQGIYGPWRIEPSDIREVMDPFSPSFLFNLIGLLINRGSWCFVPPNSARRDGLLFHLRWPPPTQTCPKSSKISSY